LRIKGRTTYLARSPLPSPASPFVDDETVDIATSYNDGSLPADGALLHRELTQVKFADLVVLRNVYD